MMLLCFTSVRLLLLFLSFSASYTNALLSDANVVDQLTNVPLSPASSSHNASYVCRALAEATSSAVFYALTGPYTASQHRYCGSTAQAPACVYTPSTPAQLTLVLHHIAAERVEFAVSCGKHSANKGFSSTTGVHIDMSRFSNVDLSDDKSYVDIGAGNIWDTVYEALDGSGVGVLGARASGIGVGGFMSGGGGYTWKTQQYGMSSDTVLQADMVLPNGTVVSVTPTRHADLFWAVRGGGNQFGIVYNWRLKVFPQPDQVYGGFRYYTEDQIPAVLRAVNNFTTNVSDPKAQVIPVINTYLGIPDVTLLGYYDGPDPGTAFDSFESSSLLPLKLPTGNDSVFALLDGWRAQSVPDLVTSYPVNISYGARGLQHSIPLERFSLPLMQQAANMSIFWGTRPGRSAVLSSFAITTLQEGYAERTATDAAWPHNTASSILEIYLAWSSSQDDEYFRNAALECVRLIKEQALAEGQRLDDMYYYPNYVLDDTPLDIVYGQAHLERLKVLKATYDPTNIMNLTTYYNFT